MGVIRNSAKILAAIVSIGIAFSVWYCLFFPGVTTFRFSAEYSACRNKLTQLGIALHNYHDAYGSFPPAVVRDSVGTPLYSWRVLVLPYIDHVHVYERFHLDQPWDSDANRPLIHELDAIRSPFTCPSQSANTGVSYLAVVGESTVWQEVAPVSLDKIPDPPSETILLVEARKSGIAWSEPRDLRFSELRFQINDSNTLSPSSEHETCIPCRASKVLPINVLMVDGSADRLPESTAPDVLRRMLTMTADE